MDNKLIFIEYGASIAWGQTATDYELTMGTEEDFRRIEEDYWDSAQDMALMYSNAISSIEYEEHEEEAYDEQVQERLGEICFVNVRFYNEETDAQHFKKEYIEQVLERGY